jgi:hypothetical protein
VPAPAPPLTTCLLKSIFRSKAFIVGAILAPLIVIVFVVLRAKLSTTEPLQQKQEQNAAGLTAPPTSLGHAGDPDAQTQTLEANSIEAPARQGVASESTAPDPVIGETLTGRVVDETGQPVDNFELRGTYRNALESKWEERDLGQHSGGQFVLRDLNKGAWRIFVTHPDFLPAKPTRARLPYKGEPIVIQLQRGAVLSGSVVDPAGVGLANAKLVLKTGSRTENHSTNDSGEFRLVISPGPFACIGVGDNFAASAEIRGDLRAGEKRHVELLLTEGGRLIGSVQSVEGKVQSRHWVYLHGMNWMMQDSNIQANEAGRFAFEHLTPGTYWAGVSKDAEASRASMTVRKVVEIEAGETTEVVLGGVNKDEVLLSGTVFVGGVPAPDFRVWGGLNDPTTFSQGKAVATDDRGTYELSFPGPGPGHFLVIFGQQQYALVPIEVGQGPLQEFDIHAPNGVLAGQVVSGVAPAKSKKKIQVRCMPEGFAPAMTRSLTRSLLCEPDGRFRFENLTPGMYRVEVSGYKNRGSAVQDLEVGMDSEVTDIKLLIGGKGNVIVRVVDPEGRPLEGAHVYAIDMDGVVHNHPLVSAATNTGGQIKLRKLDLESYRFFAQHKQWVSKGSAATLINEDKKQVVTLQAIPGGHLDFQFPEFAHPQQARIWVVGSQGFDFSSTLLTFDAEKYVAEGEHDSRKRIGPLPPGDYTVRIQDFGSPALEGTATVRAGESTQVQLKRTQR